MIPLAGWVAPFGDPGITDRSHLPRAFRSVPRPSSPLSAKASTRCPSLALPSHTQRQVPPDPALHQQCRWSSEHPRSQRSAASPDASSASGACACGESRGPSMRQTRLAEDTLCGTNQGRPHRPPRSSRAVTQLASSPCHINHAPGSPPGSSRGQFRSSRHVF